MSKVPRLSLKLMSGKWCITGESEFQGMDLGLPYGPYNSKTEAESDRVGMVRSLRHFDEAGYWTTDKLGEQ